MRSGHISCGAGGDILGAKMAGVKPVWAFDKNASAVATVSANHGDVHAFMADIKSIDTASLDPVDLIICGIPCQPYTRIGRRLGENDEREISGHVARVIKISNPRYVVFENVKEYDSSVGFKLLNEILSHYQINWRVLNVADYGVPQRRRRLFGIGAQDFLPQFPSPTHTKQRSLFDQRPSWIPFKAIKDGQGMKPLSVKAIRGVLRRLANHSKRGNGFSVQIIDEKDMMMTVMGVMYRGSWTSSHSTLVLDNGVFRNVSFLEARRAQGFPDEYVFCGTLEEQWKQVGNAFPPLMVKTFIKAIRTGYDGLDFRP